MGNLEAAFEQVTRERDMLFKSIERLREITAPHQRVFPSLPFTETQKMSGDIEAVSPTVNKARSCAEFVRECREAIDNIADSLDC